MILSYLWILKDLHDSCLLEIQYNRDKNFVELKFESSWVQKKYVTLIFSDRTC